MNNETEKYNRQGAALLVVLFLVMTITVLSIGFLTQSDVELACGQNMAVRAQMDYLAESALEHAKGLIMTPQDANGEYWTGAPAQQIVFTGNDYYDVNVTKLTECNYQVDVEAYRKQGSAKIARSRLKAELRINPCIAYRTGDTWTSDTEAVINGDVCVRGTIENNSSGNATIIGDAYAKNNIEADNITGQKYENVSAGKPLAPPSFVDVDFFAWHYYVGSDRYSTAMYSGGLTRHSLIKKAFIIFQETSNSRVM